MSSETAVLIAIGLVLFVVALAFGFSQGVLDSSLDSVLGNQSSPGLIDCNPAADDTSGCPEQSSWTHETRKSVVST